MATGPVEDAVPEGRVTPEGGLADRAQPLPNGDGASARPGEAAVADVDERLDGPTVRATRPTPSASSRAGRHTKHKQRSPLRNLLEWGGVIIGAIVVAFLVKTFLFQAFWIPSPSMSPTLVKGDRVLVNKLSYDLHDVNRGDVVVFERPATEDTSQIKDLIKRVVAVGGDRVSIMDGKVRLNGKVIDEPYTHDLPTTYSSCGVGKVDGIDTEAGLKIPEGEVFVMGDNRVNSHDGRCFGPIDEDLIVGRAFFIPHLGSSRQSEPEVPADCSPSARVGSGLPAAPTADPTKQVGSGPGGTRSPSHPLRRAERAQVLASRAESAVQAGG